MSVLYDSKQIIPAPFVAIHRDDVTTEDGTQIASNYIVTVRGKLFAEKGSPQSDGTFWTAGAGSYPPDENPQPTDRLDFLLRKKEALCRLFGTNGKTFEIDPIFPNSDAPLKCYPVVKSIQFDEGIWWEYMPYTITLECPDLFGKNGAYDDFTYRITKATEDWSLEPADEWARTYKLTHTLSATGRLVFSAAGDGTLLNGKAAWQNAQDWVQAKLGIDPKRVAADGTLSLDTYSAYNYMRTEHANELSGGYSVTETWLVFDVTGLPAPAIEEYTLQVRVDETGRTRATIDGNIKGLEVRDNTTHALISTRYENVVQYWNNVQSGIFTRVQAGVTAQLNPVVVSTTQGVNDISGVLTYQFEYNDRPVSLVNGARFETLSIAIDNKVDIMAQVVVLGRALGPVIQDILTDTAGQKTVTYEAQMPASTYQTGVNTNGAPNTDGIMATFAPVAVTQFWVMKDTPNWNPITGKYTRTTTWGFI